MKAFKASLMQSAYFTWLETGTGSAILDATAGSGKSTTLVRGLLHMPEKADILLLAFGKDAATELGEKVIALGKETGRDMSRVQCKTFHSWGFGAVRRALGNVKLDDNKVRTLAQDNLSREDYDKYGKVCVNLVRLAKGEGIGALTEGAIEEWTAIRDHHDIDLDTEDSDWNRAFEIADALMRDSIRLADDRGIIDYADQLYLPVLWNLTFPKQDFLLIDEAQDSNPVRRAIARMTLKPNGRLVACGDNDQAIVGFAGASNDALDLIAADFGCTVLPLTVSYRCPKTAEKYAKQFSEKFSVHQDAPEGFVNENATMADALKTLTDSDAILCRNTAPLIKLAYQIIKSGRGCYVAGKEIGKGLSSLILKMKAKGIDNLQEKLTAYLDRETAKFLAKKQEEKADALSDKVECINVLIEGLPETGRTIPALIAKIESMFEDKEKMDKAGIKRLILSTMHKAKGLEWNNVGIIRWDLCPSKYARQAWQRKQERNLQFVATSRHKNGLLFIKDEKMDK